MNIMTPIERHDDRIKPAWRLRGAATAALLAGSCLSGAPVLAAAPTCAPPPAHKLATSLATIKVGDYWIYSLSGTITPPASAKAPGPLPLAGTFVEDVETRTFQGKPTMALVVVQNITAGGVSIYGKSPAPQEIFYVEQDPKTKAVLVLGDNAGPNGADRVALQPEVFYLGQWSKGASYNDVLNFTSGDKTGLYLNVTGTTTISTHIGDFQAWVAPNGSTTATGATLDTGTDYWSPQLGAPVAFSTVTQMPDGSVNRTSATLIKSNKVNSLYPVVADKLDEPRGLTFDPLGLLWFTEAGTGGTGPCIAFMGTTNCFGNSGRVSAILAGRTFTIDGKLASLGTPLLDQVTGPNGIAFADNKPYVVIGDGGPQFAVAGLGSLQSQTGVLLTVGVTKGGIAAKTVASTANYEYVNDPDDRPNPDGTLTPESNPYGVAAIGSNLYVADGGAHTVVKVTPAGAISVVGIIPPQMVNQAAFPGGPVPTLEDSVPTGVIPAPDGKGLLVADYTGFPYFPGTSRIWRVQSGQPAKLFASGFSSLIGLSRASDGGVYALEMASNGANSGDPGGSVIHVSPSGERKVLACQGLIQPTGIATSPSGDAVYVSNYGLNSGYGQVVKIPTR